MSDNDLLDVLDILSYVLNEIENEKLLDQVRKDLGKNLNFSLFKKLYKPIVHPNYKEHNPNDDCLNNYMFETYGKDFEFVNAQDPKKVFTYIDAEGDLIVCTGKHFVNRFGYFVTEIPYEEDFEFVDIVASEDYDDELYEEESDFYNKVKNGEEQINLSKLKDVWSQLLNSMTNFNEDSDLIYQDRSSGKFYKVEDFYIKDDVFEESSIYKTYKDEQSGISFSEKARLCLDFKDQNILSFSYSVLDLESLINLNDKLITIF